MKNGQQQLALRRVTSFEIAGSGAFADIEVRHSTGDGVVSLLQGEEGGNERLMVEIETRQVAHLIAALTAIQAEIGEAAPAQTARKRTDVAGWILRFIEFNEVSVANETAILMSALDLTRDQVTAALPRMKKSRRIVEHAGLLRRLEDLPSSGSPL
jgi:hypothetical protein